MKLRNNLTEEAFENSYRIQGYDEEQIEALMWMLDDGLGVEKLMTPNIDAAHMSMLLTFAEMDVDVEDEYFFDDGTLDVEELEYDFSNFEHYQSCSKYY